LSHGGFLCLGMHESLPLGSSERFVDFASNERIYRRTPS